VEGSIGATVQNVRDRSIHVLQHFNGRNSQSLISCGGEDSIPRIIPLPPITIAVIVAVDLDQQPPRQACEISDIAVDGILLAELQSVGSRAQNIPHEHFRQTHLAPECASETDIVVGCTYSPMFHSLTILPGTGRWQPVRADGGVDTPFDPTTMLRMVPLPVPGRI
jgi:hypothetical protein